MPASGIGDGLHLLTTPLNELLQAHAILADALLIVSSSLIDLFSVFLLARLSRPWLKALAWFVAVFEMATVLVLRAHYTMDVFTGMVTALGAAVLAEQLSPPIDRWMNRSSTSQDSGKLIGQ